MEKEVISMSEKVSEHYDEDYFDWQAEAGEFGGWANQTKFVDYISKDDVCLLYTSPSPRDS